MTSDKAEAGHARLGLRGKPAAIEQLAFEGREKALAHRIIVSIPDGAHRRPDVRFLAAIAEGKRRVLRSLIAMNEVVSPAVV